MAASGGVDVANLVIEGSCTFQDYGVVEMHDGDYRLLAITSSGNLVPAQPVNMEVCVVGGGANGLQWGNRFGGAGAYMKNQVIEAFDGGEVVVGAAQGTSSIGGVSVATVSGKSGGTGGGGVEINSGGNGDGLSKYPFGDNSYELWSGKPHCAGGGGGGVSNDYGSFRGGSGGTNGGNGGSPAGGAGDYGGIGGTYGGGNGGRGSVSGTAGSNATYYGSGGGGAGYYGSTTPAAYGSGYQGIVYVRIPVDQAAGGGGAPIGAPISDLPLGALINIGTDGGAGAPNYEIADKDNLVSGGVVLVRKNIYSISEFGSNENYHNGTLDNLIKTTIYNKMPQKLRDKMMDVSFPLYKSDNITRKMFALTYTMAGFGNHREVAEGKALQLYTSDASRVKTFNGSANGWWLSSRFTSGYAWYVYPDGRSNGGNSSSTLGVVPAFVIPGDTLSKLTPNTDGSYNLIL